MASSSRGLLTLFPDLNESTREITSAVALEPQPSAPGFAPLNFPMRSVEQKMAVQTDIEANQYTLKSCVETMTAVTNLSHRLQSRTNEVQQLNAQLALLQRMYKDARAEISGSSTMEDKKEEEGLLLGAEKDDSSSVVGFHLIPPSTVEDSKAINTLDKLPTDGESTKRNEYRLDSIVDDFDGDEHASANSNAGNASGGEWYSGRRYTRNVVSELTEVETNSDTRHFLFCFCFTTIIRTITWT
ncbi:hypothetical protein CsSME_00022894 [Camellia sinensis var. sinensis]